MEVQNDEPAPQEEALSFDLQRYLEALRKYVWAILALVGIAIAGAVVYTNRQPKIYEAVASVQIEPRLPDLLGKGGADDFVNAGVGPTTEYYKQQRQVLSSYRLLRQTVEQHRLHQALLSEAERADRKLDDLVEIATERLRPLLRVTYPEQDRIMYVVVRSTNRVLAADIANAHIRTYEAYAKGLLSTDTKKASGALSTEFDDAEAKLRDAESALYAFQKDNDLLAVSL